MAGRLPHHRRVLNTKAQEVRMTRKEKIELAAPPSYSTSLEHILAELERIDLLIESQVARARQLNKDNEFQGLYISEQEIETMIEQPIGLPRWAIVPPVSSEPGVSTAMEQLTASILMQREAAVDKRVPLRLATLTERFQLTAFDVDVLLICLAPELDLSYERLYAYLQDDVTRKRPSVDLVLNLLCPSFLAKTQCRARFDASAPLVRHMLIAIQDDASASRSPLINRFLKLDDRIVSYLLGQDELDARISSHAVVVEPDTSLPDKILENEEIRGLTALLKVHRDSGGGLSMYFHGPYGVGKRSAAEALCHQLGLGLIVVDADKLAAASADFPLSARLVNREGTLQNAAVYWQGFDSLVTEERRVSTARFLQELRQHPGIVFMSGETEMELADALHLPSFARVEFPRPAYGSRLPLWKTELEGWGSSEAEIAGLANKFRFTSGQIRDAAAAARSLALRRAPESSAPTIDDLVEACHLQSNRKLRTLASRITPHYTWSDMVLPPDRLRQLREICKAVEYRSIVYDQWGFEQKLSLGKGLNLLFAGPSGTGKTMAAEVIARELGLELYRIDLSSVISKYIGETEKNLSRIFDEAATSNAVLFFDEADALFGKRSEVRESHDRYANIEINYLLQKMEQYEGTVILATNMRKNMDDAFLRRIQFAIEFPFPGFDQRLSIWQKVWPAATPRENLDLEFMARRFEVTGGNIRNIALAAAFLGAEDGGLVTMKHLIRATWQEHHKMGKVIMEGEFGEYSKLQ
jgi:SpoVK/Ycf46/Vps4 family AAA+-type ATPase